MRTFEKIVPGVSLLKVPFNDGSYDTGVMLVRCGGQTVLIDSGERDETVDEYILPALNAEKADRADLLLCTHNHGDHSGGHRRLREITNCPIAVFEGDCAQFPTPVDRVLRDGEEIIPGLRLIATPGHTLHAVSFLHEESGTLITGDSFQGCGTDGVGLALLMDAGAYRQSIRRAMEMEPGRMVAGHGFAPCDFVIEGKMRVRAFLQCCMDTVSRYEVFIARHAALDDAALAALLVAQEGRTLARYIVRGDSTVSALRKSARGAGGEA